MRLKKEAIIFLDMLYEDLEGADLKLEGNFLDHLCYRSQSEESYIKVKSEFFKFSKLLIESKVGGRFISTFKLDEPIIYKGRRIHIIEIPAPKDGSEYLDGYEHAEFVISESFDDWVQLHSDLDFNFKGANKKFNPELMLSLKNVNIKFHHQSLEEVISIEIKSGNK